ncbi:sulfite oxidase-like isoform X1 [Artemia franciscana]|uniref:sulfite oxidase-like isoform X1 n=1 Tax=Artemia franciscana TaxID=6661 RepID=UPI0032DA0910
MLSLKAGRSIKIRSLAALCNHGFEKKAEYSSHEFERPTYRKHMLYATIGVGVSVATLFGIKNKVQAKSVAKDASQPQKLIGGEFRKDLPVYRATDVAKRDSKENRIWVSYKRGVYDVTDFVAKHPGGEKILMAAGGATEPFWGLYAVHFAPRVMELMEQYRIGNLHEDDVIETPSEEDGPYGQEPVRNKILVARSSKPCNAETPPELLIQDFITPNDVFYVRNHLPVPQVDPLYYELEVTGIGIKDKSFTLDELKKFPKHKLVMTIMCAGNRRSEMNKVREVKGLEWALGAVGTAEWAGVRLQDLLESLGFDPKTNKAAHIQFEGLDLDPASSPYGASVPIRTALISDVILAYEMNGEPIPRDHGYPIRACVPGVVGARNVKWLGKIVLSHEESQSHWQQRDYKGFSPTVDFEHADWKSSPAIQDLPVTSAICNLKEGDVVQPVNGKVTVKGYAWSGGGRKIARVDITCDKGKTWHVARHDPGDKSGQNVGWAWTLWTAEIPVSQSGTVEIWAKAVDDSYNTQPETFENIWNIRGVLSNAYHKVKVHVQ